MSETTTAKAELIAREDGVLVPRNIDEAWRMAKIALASGMLPDRYKSAEMVLIASQYALELGLPPISGISKIAMVKGTPCLFADGPLALCQSRGLMEYIEEFFLDKNMDVICLANKNLQADVFAAVCTVKRKGDLKPLETFFTLAEADKAGLTKQPPSGPGVWQKFLKRMLRYRARSQALKDKFADCLNGMPIAEYDFNVIVSEESESKPVTGGLFESDSSVDSDLAEKIRIKGLQKKIEIVDAEIQA